MAITGISSYDGKQIIAAGAQSATKAYQDSNGDVITSKYQSTAGMSNYIKNTDPIISVGFENTASNWSFGQGEQNDAVAFSFAQGNQNTALTISFAQGSANYARGDSFAQGSGCRADQKSIAQGANCSAIDSAQAFGVGVVARTGMMAIGSYNNKTAYASFVIGNGTANDARSDLFYIDDSGNVSAAGKISANGVELGPGGGGGGAGVVTATGGDGTYVTSINEKPISGLGLITSISTGTYNHMAGQPLLTAITSLNSFDGILAVSSISASMTNYASSATSAYKLTNTAIKVASATSATNANTATYASNGVSLTDIYNSARSGYAASAYIAGKQIVNGRYTTYNSYNNPNWWTGNNIFGLKLNSANVFNSTGISVEGARIDAVEMAWSGNNNWLLHVNFLFNKFIPKNTADWSIVTNNFFSTTGHFVAPIYSEACTNWGATVGAVMIDYDSLWSTAIKLSKFGPWSGYTADKVLINFTVPWVNS